jgi:hypothetical protein
MTEDELYTDMTLQQMGYTLTRHYSRWTTHRHDITADGLHTDTTLSRWATH